MISTLLYTYLIEDYNLYSVFIWLIKTNDLARKSWFVFDNAKTNQEENIGVFMKKASQWKKVFCLKGLWESNLIKNSSVEPVLNLLNKRQ